MILFAGLWLLMTFGVTCHLAREEKRYRPIPVWECIAMFLIMILAWPGIVLQMEIGGPKQHE